MKAQRIDYLSALALLCLAGCGHSYDEYRASVEHPLKDPGSAQYRNDRVVTNAMGLSHYCGEINAKNSLGGYTGFRRFIASKTSVTFEREDDPEIVSRAFEDFWANNCIR